MVAEEIEDAKYKNRQGVPTAAGEDPSSEEAGPVAELTRLPTATRRCSKS